MENSPLPQMLEVSGVMSTSPHSVCLTVEIHCIQNKRQEELCVVFNTHKSPDYAIIPPGNYAAVHSAIYLRIGPKQFVAIRKQFNTCLHCEGFFTLCLFCHYYHVY